VSWFNTFYTGPEKTSTNNGHRHFYDTVLTVNPTTRTSLYANFDYGRENAPSGRGLREWVAIGVAGRIQTTEHTALALRYENYNDHQGSHRKAAALNSFTLTGEYKWCKGSLATGVPA